MCNASFGIRGVACLTLLNDIFSIVGHICQMGGYDDFQNDVERSDHDYE
jgi:hypothetical protein